MNVDENDPQRIKHKEALEKTGFWGNQAAGCIFMSRDTGRFLIAHRSEKVQEPNTWGTWGGAIDDGESPLDAVSREVHEEAGYEGDATLYHVWTFEHHTGFKYHNFIAVVEEEFEPKLDWETQGWKWCEPGCWPDPLHPGLKTLLDRAEFKTALGELQ
jgi:8-oxo-dGTP pyrophosphatase MutT (NUDIX family)